MRQNRFTDPAALKSKIIRVEHSMVDGALFMDVILAGLRLRSAAELSRSIEMTAPVLSRIRCAGKHISDSMLIALHEEFNLPIGELKQLVKACAIQANDADYDGARHHERIRELASAPMFAGRQMLRHGAAVDARQTAVHWPPPSASL